MDGNCSRLEQVLNFESYVSVLRNVTSNHLSAEYMNPCRQQICAALYGTGSSDVSGIGVRNQYGELLSVVDSVQVLVGYFVEFSLAVILAVTLMILSKRRKARLAASCREITGAYVDSAIALALSVELACAIMLIKKNFGLQVSEFGGLTVQIVWIVAALVMLPVASFCWRDLEDKKTELRLCMTALAFILFLITFICRMISTYSDRQIGSGADAVVSNEEANQIALLCFGQSSSLSPSASATVEVFSIGGSLWISCNVILALIDQCFDGSEQSQVARALQQFTKHLKSDIVGTVVSVSGLLIWSVPLFWALMTLRSWQMTFAESIDEASGSDVWSFGQIIAVIVFLPVLNELLHQYLEHDKPARPSDERQAGSVTAVAQSPKLGSA